MGVRSASFMSKAYEAKMRGDCGAFKKFINAAKRAEFEEENNIKPGESEKGNTRNNRIQNSQGDLFQSRRDDTFTGAVTLNEGTNLRNQDVRLAGVENVTNHQITRAKRNNNSLLNKKRDRKILALNAPRA